MARAAGTRMCFTTFDADCFTNNTWYEHQLYVVFIITKHTSETPRYLVWSGHNEQAWTVLRRLHHDPDDPEDRAAHAEFTQIVLQVEHDKENGGGFIQILKRPSLRKRALLVIFATYVTRFSL